MKDSARRLVAVVLGSSFALISSVVIGGIVFDHMFTDRERSSGPSKKSKLATSEKRGDASTSKSPQESGSPSKKAKKEGPSRIEREKPPKVLEEYPDRGPRMTAKGPDGNEVLLPMIKSDYSVDIRGDLATVTIEQTFENPGEVPLDAIYQLPMAEDAAVYEMVMRVGDRRVRAVVKKKQQARETYEKAKKEGKAAALLEQQRANLFTQRLANVMPGLPVRITIRYVQNVEKEDGDYQLVVPLVVGPRYEPADMSGNQLVDTPDSSTDTEANEQRVELPPVGELEAPETIDPDRIGLDVRLDGGVPVAAVGSSSHAISTQKVDRTTHTIDLTEGRTIGNRHFVLSYQLEGRSTQAGVLTHWSEKQGEGYFSLLVEPPARPSSDEVAAREMVFLLDTSGSMSGAPMEAAKTYMRHTLRNLRPKDSFRIVEFNSSTGAMTEKPLSATQKNIQEGLAYVASLGGGGGTEAVPGLERALQRQTPSDRIRIATVLSDGYVGNDYEVIKTVRREVGETRLVTMGVGSGVNRFVLEEMAEVGRGFTHYIDPTPGGDRREKIREAAKDVADKLETPVLTDISVDWGELSPRGTTPDPVPDLFAGQSIRIMGRYDEPGRYDIEVSGRAGGEEVTVPIEAELPGEPTDGRAVELTWARSRVEDFMHELTTPVKLRQGSLSDEDYKRLVTQLGLDHEIATKWTSFVAVSEKVVNPNPEKNAEAAVPEPQVANVTEAGYRRRSGGGGAHGAPEPSLVVSLWLALLACLGIAGRRP